MKTIEIFNSNVTINDNFNVIKKNSHASLFNIHQKCFLNNQKALHR